MLRQNWVRTAATHDARSHRLEVTDHGREMIERALPLWREAQAEAREVLGYAVADQLFEAVDAPFSENPPVGGRAVGNESEPKSKPVTSRVSGDQSKALAVSEQARTGDQPKERGIFFWE